MKEKLYDRSEAVAALNRVEGFNPMELARTLTKEGQEDQLYLDVKYRKLWFRLVHPLGKIVSSIRSFTENMAIVEARIYLDKCDAEENYIANAFSQKFRTNDPNFGDKFLEMAETAAVGRALSDAGFGLQFADVGEADDPMQVDAGIQIPGTTAQSQGQGNDTPQGEMPWTPQMQSDMQGGQNPLSAMTGSPNMPRVMTGNQGPSANAQNQGVQSQPMPQGNGNPQSRVPAQSNNMMNQFYQQAQEKGATIGPVDELVQRMTYEQAAQVVINGNGKFGGKTMGQVAVESPKNLEWFAQSYSGKNHLIPAAARVLLNAAMQMAG